MKYFTNVAVMVRNRPEEGYKLYLAGRGLFKVLGVIEGPTVFKLLNPEEWWDHQLSVPNKRNKS